MSDTSKSILSALDESRSMLKFVEGKIAFLEMLKPNQLYHVRYVKNDRWSRVGFLGYLHTGKTPIVDNGVQSETEAIFRVMATESKNLTDKDKPRPYTHRVSHLKWIMGEITLDEWDFDSLPICLGWPSHNGLLEHALKYGPEEFWKESII
jgi:hypothetical protein